jgi:twitching motility protein PilT
MARIDSFLRLVAEQHASDLHFHTGNPPIVRHHGNLVPLPFRILSREESRRFIYEILTPEQRQEFEQTNDLDFIYAIEGVGRFRTNLLLQTQGIGAVFRIIPDRPPRLDELKLPAAVDQLTQLQNGLVIISGPSGSGKTTTLAAMVNEINQKSHRHVITIEDPIEFLHAPVMSSITQRQVGKHAESFPGALRSALRESPDVLVIGEMRDLETITLALSATEAGVLVFGGLHTSSAAKAIHRIIDGIPEDGRDQMRAVLSVLLRCVINQQLCKRADGQGRVAAVEILLQNYAVSHMIRDNKLHQLDAYLQSLGNDGSGAQSLDHAIFKLVKQGTVTLDEAVRMASHPQKLNELIHGLPAEA